jgi:hypothetical protein
MVFGIQMYHEVMQVKFEYGCALIIIKGVIALGLRKLIENEFPFIFSLMVSNDIFGIQMYQEDMQVKFEYGCCPIIIGEVIALGLRKLIEIDSFHSFSVMVGCIQRMFGIQMYHEEMQVKFEYGCCPIIIGGRCIFIHLQLPQNC